MEQWGGGGPESGQAGACGGVDVPQIVGGPVGDNGDPQSQTHGHT